MAQNRARVRDVIGCDPGAASSFSPYQPTRQDSSAMAQNRRRERDGRGCDPSGAEFFALPVVGPSKKISFADPFA